MQFQDPTNLARLTIADFGPGVDTATVYPMPSDAAGLTAAGIPFNVSAMPLFFFSVDRFAADGTLVKAVPFTFTVEALVALPSAELDVWSCASTGSECSLIQNVTFTPPATFHVAAPHTSVFAGALRPSVLHTSPSPAAPSPSVHPEGTPTASVTPQSLLTASPTSPVSTPTLAPKPLPHPTPSQTPVAAGDDTWLAAAEIPQAAEQGSTSLVLIVLAAAVGTIGVVVLAVCVRLVWRWMRQKPSEVTLPVPEPGGDQGPDTDLGQGNEPCPVPVPVPVPGCLSNTSPKRTPAEEFRGFEEAL